MKATTTKEATKRHRTVAPRIVLLSASTLLVVVAFAGAAIERNLPFTTVTEIERAVALSPDVQASLVPPEEPDDAVPTHQPAPKAHAGLETAKRPEEPKDKSATTGASTPVPSPSKRGGCEDYREIASRYWSGPNLLIALAVMKAESGCDPKATSDLDRAYEANGRKEGLSCGLMKIRVTEDRPSCDELLDVTVNLDWAHRVYLRGGSNFRPWTSYENGEYRKYL